MITRKKPYFKACAIFASIFLSFGLIPTNVLASENSSSKQLTEDECAVTSEVDNSSILSATDFFKTKFNTFEPIEDVKDEIACDFDSMSQIRNASSPTVSYSVNGYSLVGNTIDIAVNVSNVSGLYGASVDFICNTNLIKIKKISQGSLFNQKIKSPLVQYFTSGNAHIALPLQGKNTPAINGKGSLAIITAEVVGTGSLNLKTIDNLSKLSLSSYTSCVKLSDINGNRINYTPNNTTLTCSKKLSLTSGSYEETNLNLTYNGTWFDQKDANNSGGAGKYSATVGSSVSFNFTGTGFSWYGFATKNRGIAKVTIDGTSYNVDTSSAANTYKKAIYTKTGLAYGNHTAKIEVTSTKNPSSNANTIFIDSLKVYASDPTKPLTAGTYEETNSDLTYNGSWIAQKDANNSGGAGKYSATAGSSVSFTFTGTGFSWYGFATKNRGIAKVTIDGTSYNVDTSSAANTYKKEIYTKTGLAYGNHTVKIEVTSTKNPSSNANTIFIDSLKVYASDPLVPLTAGTYEETNSKLNYAGSWVSQKDANNSNGTGKYSATAGSSVSFAFTGTGFSWYGFATKNRGIAKVTIDGTSYNVDTSSAANTYKKEIYTKTGLAYGNHTVKIEVTSTKNPSSNANTIFIDSLKVYASNPVAPLTAGTYEETNSKLTYTGSWVNHKDANNSNGTGKYSATAGSSVSFTFTGTGFSWYGFATQNRGIAKVTIDGTSYNVDTSSAANTYKKEIYTKTGLAYGNHTVKIEVTSTKNPSSNANTIFIDSLKVYASNPVAPLTAGTYEETNSKLTYTGSWVNHKDANNSNGTGKYSATAGSSVSFTFTGTGFSWYGFATQNRGIAKVTIDGTSYTVDTSSATNTYKKQIYTKTGLAYGNHTVKIEVTSTKNPSSNANTIFIDSLKIV